MAARAASSTTAAPTGRRCARSRRPSRFRSSSTATSAASTTPTRALAASGADAVMIGRGAQGRPWFPGQVARYLATGDARARAAARRAVRADRRALRRDARASRRARSAAAMPASISAGRSMPPPRPPASPSTLLKAHRARVLTAEEPARGPPPARRGLSTPSPGGPPHEPRAQLRSADCRSAPPTRCSTRCRIR